MHLPTFHINTIKAHNAIHRSRTYMEIGQWTVAAAALAVGMGLVILIVGGMIADRRRKAADEVAEVAAGAAKETEEE